MIQQGHIISVPFPYSNFKGLKIRPALIVSNANVNNSSDVIAVQISKKPDPFGPGIALDVQDFSEGNLREKSSIYPHRIHLIEKSTIIGIIGKVKPHILKEALEKIQEFLS